MGMEYYDMVRSILKPALSKSLASDQSELVTAMQTYKLNEPQARAILSALQTGGFSLIQGYIELIVLCSLNTDVQITQATRYW
jgi:senataxin